MRHVTKRQAARLAAGLFFALALAAGTARLHAGRPTGPTPLTATFRCQTTAECATLGAGDTFGDDGWGAYAYNATSGEGAFVNSNGGLTINLVTGGSSPDRAFAFTFPVDTDTAACNRAFTAVYPTKAELRINAIDTSGNTLGLEGVPVGGSADGFGLVNFQNPTGDGYAWTVRFAPGDVTVARADASHWTIESLGASVLLQCSTTKGKTVTKDDGYYWMPFRITVVKP